MNTEQTKQSQNTGNSSSPYLSAYSVLVLYAFLIILLAAPYVYLIFFPELKFSNLFEMYGQPVFWIYLAILLACYAVMLMIPIKTSLQRPVSKKPVIVTVVTGSFLLATLFAGFVLMFIEVFRVKKVDPWMILCLAVFIVSWISWGVFFWRYSKSNNPSAVSAKLIHFLYRGSLLEMLVAVPSHIIARSRNECCAGIFTFTSLTFGVSIMIISFGPGVYFLYKKRLERYSNNK